MLHKVNGNREILGGNVMYNNHDADSNACLNKNCV
jgi:hypothetical protein